MKKKFLAIGIIIVATFLVTGCGEEKLDTDKDSTNDNKENVQDVKTYKFNETFKYDGFEITIGDNYTFETLQNPYSDLDGKDMIKLPITVKNTLSETRGYSDIFLAVFGPDGTETKKLAVMSDDDISVSDDLLENASFTKNMYILYAGDGEYVLDYQDEEIKVKLDIKK